MTVNVDKLINWQKEEDAIEQLMEPYYENFFALAYDDAGNLLSGDIDFDQSNPLVRRTIGGLAKNIRGVADTTKEEIRGLVDKATEEGWSAGELAKQIREKGEIASKSRSLTIARTESATAYNMGATLAYKEAGVSKVEVVDGDEDDVCAQVNGQVWTLKEAQANPIGHPNCTRAFIPIVD